MTHRDVVVAGASAGGVESLRGFVSGLPADFPAAVLVVLHVSATGSALGSILDRAGPLPAAVAGEGALIEPGRIYAAPADRHMLVRDGHIVLSKGPRESGHRPAVDPLFRSAARWRGRRAVGVVLSGTLDDGASGLATIGRYGGATLVQDPAEALYPGMPQAALAAVPDAVVGSAVDLAKIADRLVREPLENLGDPPGDDPRLEREVAIAEFDVDELNEPDRLGEAAGLGCPDCNGALFWIEDTPRLRYRCRVGHAWSAEALAARHDEELESALWMALRTLEDKAALHRRIALAATEREAQHVADWNERTAREAAESAQVIRALLVRDLTTPA